MHTTYAAYTAALDAGDLAQAMSLEAHYLQQVDTRNRWYVIGMTALYAVCAIIPVHLLTTVLA